MVRKKCPKGKKSKTLCNDVGACGKYCVLDNGKKYILRRGKVVLAPAPPSAEKQAKWTAAYKTRRLARIRKSKKKRRSKAKKKSRFRIKSRRRRRRKRSRRTFKMTEAEAIEIIKRALRRKAELRDEGDHAMTAASLSKHARSRRRKFDRERRRKEQAASRTTPGRLRGVVPDFTSRQPSDDDTRLDDSFWANLNRLRRR